MSPSRWIFFFGALAVVGAPCSSARADVFVANYDGMSVTVYAQDEVADVPPIRALAGPETLLGEPSSLFVDLTNDELYVCDFFGEAIRVFARDANGDVEPLRSLVNGPSSMLGQPRNVAVDPGADEVYVVSANERIAAFSRSSDGDVAPSRVITGPSTSLNNPIGLAIDLSASQLYTTSYDVGGPGNPGILVFDATAEGDVPPIRTIVGPNADLGSYVNALALDAESDELFVQAGEGAAVLVFDRSASGDVAPKRTLSGPTTRLVNIQGISIDPASGYLFVLSSDQQDEVLVFDRNASGDAAPIAVLAGANTEINGGADVFGDGVEAETGTGGTTGTTDGGDTAGTTTGGAPSTTGGATSTSGGTTSTPDTGEGDAGGMSGGGGCGCVVTRAGDFPLLALWLLLVAAPSRRARSQYSPVRRR